MPDLPPKFDSKNYKFEILENQPFLPLMSNPFGRVNAIDQDVLAVRQLTYSLIEPNDFIGIIGVTGELYAKVVFDAENDSMGNVLSFDVQVTENHGDKWLGQPLLTDTTTVTIIILDENDNIPEIIINSTEQFFIEEERGSRAEITGPEIMIVDGDKPRVSSF